MTHPPETATTDDERRAWSDAHIKPLWEIYPAHAPEERSATLWPWRTMLPMIRRACELASPDIVERRGLPPLPPGPEPRGVSTTPNPHPAHPNNLPGANSRGPPPPTRPPRILLSGPGAA